MRLLFASLLAAAALATTAPVATAVTFNVVNNGTTSYRIDGIDNPPLNLVRGQTYTFNVNAPGHPFYVKSIQGSGTGNAYNAGVTNNGTDSGTLTWTVPAGAPSTLFYNCQFHSNMTGQINVTTPLLPAMTPLGAGVLVLLLAGAGFVLVRRRSASRRNA